MNYKGYTVTHIEIDYSGRYPEMTIHTKKGGRDKSIKWVSPLRNTLNLLQKDIKAIIDDEVESDRR